MMIRDSDILVGQPESFIVTVAVALCCVLFAVVSRRVMAIYYRKLGRLTKLIVTTCAHLGCIFANFHSLFSLLSSVYCCNW